MFLKLKRWLCHSSPVFGPVHKTSTFYWKRKKRKKKERNEIAFIIIVVFADKRNFEKKNNIEISKLWEMRLCIDDKKWWTKKVTNCINEYREICNKKKITKSISRTFIDVNCNFYFFLFICRRKQKCLKKKKKERKYETSKRKSLNMVDDGTNLIVVESLLSIKLY